MSSLIGQLIDSRVCTLHELKTIYSLQDAYIMWEAITVPRQNSYAAHEYSVRMAEIKAKASRR